MLVLMRKKNESIIIDDHIRVTVIEIRGDKVRLGIKAPKSITIHREEIWLCNTVATSWDLSAESAAKQRRENEGANDDR